MAFKKYAWELWFRNKEFTLKKEVDFHCSISTICIQARMAGNRLGYSVSIMEIPEGIRITRKKRSKKRAKTTK